MRAIGFSTGAVARGDVAVGVKLSRGCPGASAIELSALRREELRPLIAAAPALDLVGFQHVSVHAPSRFPSGEETEVVDLLAVLPDQWPIIVHPDAIHSVESWRRLGSRITIENMDHRKPTGRTPAELRPFFDALPDAGFCLDLAHAVDVGGGRDQILALLDEHGERLRQIHVSALTTRGEHRPLTDTARREYELISARIPPSAAVIIESVVSPSQMEEELGIVSSIFSSQAGGD